MWTSTKTTDGAALAMVPEFETLLRNHQSMVFSIACHYLGDAGRAEEIAQDVFLQLHRELHRLESENHAIAWLRRVAAHRSIDALRNPMASRSVELDAIPEPGADTPHGDVLLEDAVRKMVGSLPEKQRIAIVLRYQEDMEPMEIAEVLGMPLATVKSHLRRGLDLLRQKATRLWREQA